MLCVVCCPASVVFSEGVCEGVDRGFGWACEQILYLTSSCPFVVSRLIVILVFVSLSSSWCFGPQLLVLRLRVLGLRVDTSTGSSSIQQK